MKDDNARKVAIIIRESTTKGDEKSSFLVVNRFQNFKTFSVCNMSFKFVFMYYNSVKQDKMLRNRDIKARFSHSENCPAPLSCFGENN